jgi:hypothetical protein
MSGLLLDRVDLVWPVVPLLIRFSFPLEAALSVEQMELSLQPNSQLQAANVIQQPHPYLGTTADTAIAALRLR